MFGYGAGGRALTTTGPDDRAPGQPLASGGIVRDVPVIGEDGCVYPDRYTYIGGPVRRPTYQIVGEDGPEWVDLPPGAVIRPKP